MKSAAILYKSIYKPRRWRSIHSAPTDGRPIILRNPAWTYDLVVTWGRLAEHGIKSEEEEGWIWENCVIARGNAAAPFNLKDTESADMRETTWSSFALTPQTSQQLDLVEHIEQLEKTQSQH